MNVHEIKKDLMPLIEKGDTKGIVGITNYCAYLTELATEKNKDGSLKAWWVSKVSDTQFVNIFKKVWEDNLIIDGKMVTLQFKGKLMASYNYQAYKNKLLVNYPETLFDIQLVNEGDDFHVKKESGKVIYKHSIVDPFNKEKDIIGVYCIIKNRRGEFIETLNMTEIDKMKRVAKTKNIWNEWFGEMCKKSAIKRACKTHFNDIVEKSEVIDNENNEPEQVTVDNEMQEKIDNCKDLDELTDLYNLNKDDVEDINEFLRLLGEKRIELTLTTI